MANNKLMYPSFYLFLGDCAVELWEQYRERIPSGAVSLLVTTKDADVHEQASLYVVPTVNEADDKNTRRAVWDGFFRETESIIVLNRLIRNIKSNIQRKSQDSSYRLEKINVFVVTYTHDPINILLRDISALTKSILAEDFPVVSLELFSLLEEGDDKEDFSLKQAVTMAYLRELDELQRKDVYKKPIKISAQGIVTDCVVSGALFQMSFLVSDRDEHGRLSENGRTEAGDIIKAVEVLKNTPNSPFNEDAFSTSTLPQSLFASMGIGVLNTPTDAIHATVVHHFYDYLLSRLRANNATDIDLAEICRGIRSDEMPWQDEFECIMQNETPFSELTGKSYKDAERLMFGNTFEDFFNNNCVKQEMVNSKDNIQKIDVKLSEIIPAALERHGIYALCGFSHNRFEQMKAETNDELTRLNSEVEWLYMQHVPPPGLKDRMFKDQYYKQIKRYMSGVYVLKYKLLRCKELLMLISYCERLLEDYKNGADARIEVCEALSRNLKTNRDMLCEGLAINTSTSWKSDKQGNLFRTSSKKVYKNIVPYYKQITDGTIKDLERSGVIDEIDLYTQSEDEEILYRNITDFCQKHIFSRSEFNVTFDEELQERSNVAVDEYGEDILYREDFYKQLSEMLDYSSAMRISLTKPCEEFYTEKYYLGGMESRFMKYLQNHAQHIKTRTACVEVSQADGLIQVNVMGGFSIEHLRCYKGCEENYKGYKNAGYDFGNMFDTASELQSEQI